MSEIQFTDRELDIMSVLWDRGPSTVAEVQSSLTDELAYTTVLTMLRVLEDKGHVAHRSSGRAHVYRATVDRGRAGRSALRRLVPRLFGGSAAELMLHLVGGEEISQDELRRMRELLDRHLEKGDSE